MSPLRSVNQAGTGTLVVSAGEAYLHRVSVNTGAASGVLTVYANNAGSGTKVGTYDATAARYWDLGGVYCRGGITIVVSGGAADVTVSFQ